MQSGPRGAALQLRSRNQPRCTGATPSGIRPALSKYQRAYCQIYTPSTARLLQSSARGTTRNQSDQPRQCGHPAARGTTDQPRLRQRPYPSKYILIGINPQPELLLKQPAVLLAGDLMAASGVGGSIAPCGKSLLVVRVGMQYRAGNTRQGADSCNEPHEKMMRTTSNRCLDFMP